MTSTPFRSLQAQLAIRLAALYVAATAVAGIIPLALGNFVWDQGFRRGDSRLLAVMAYATPLCSALLLASLGAALLTWNLLAGATVIVLAGLLSRSDADIKGAV